MIRRHRTTHAIAWLAALTAASPTLAQRVISYTESAGGANSIVYGLPVPTPIDSLTPVDGFRSYAALEARLQALALASGDLSAHDIGRSANGRVQWAYVASSENALDVDARPKAAFFINATTHAREWGAPEVAAGTLERLVAGADDGGVVRYLLDNTRVIVVPVHNIDGFLQTQRYPTQAVLGADPDYPQDWPRDGRMRRKNMPGVDEVLTTFADHLGGTDLNRNHPPFWATSTGSGGSSADPRSLTFHGTSPHGEAENLSLERAAELGPVTRLRLGIDVHSFSQVFYGSNTGRTRLNAIQNTLIAGVRAHHRALTGKDYNNVPDPPNRGIGAAAEYFAYEWLVPAWTLELEPRTSAAEYGGTNASHGGFILPASQARRVREGWAESHLLAFYRMAGPAHLKRVRIFDVETGQLVQTRAWSNGALGMRLMQSSGSDALAKGRRYRAELAFSKPMRLRDAGGAIVPSPAAPDVPAQVGVGLRAGSSATVVPLDTSAGQWLDDTLRVLRYRDDTFAFEFDAPEDEGLFGLEVSARDFSGLSIDAAAATPADWQDGAWTAYENTAGEAGDTGGTDRNTMSFLTRDDIGTETPFARVVAAPTVVGEGDTARIVLRRVGDVPPDNAIFVQRAGGGVNGELVYWTSDDHEDKVLPYRMLDDAHAGGDTTVELQLVSSRGPLLPSMPTIAHEIALPPLAVRVLDNDSDDLVVLRSHDNGLNLFDALWLATGVGEQNDRRTGAAAVVVDSQDGIRELPGRDDNITRPSSWNVAGPLTLYGNQAALPPQRGGVLGGPIFRVAPEGALRIDAVDLRMDANHVGRQIVENDGQTRLSRSMLGGGASPQSPIRSRGSLDIERSTILGPDAGQQAMVAAEGGTLTMRASTFGWRDGGPRASFEAGGADVELFAASPIGAFHAVPAPRSVTFGHQLAQDGANDAIPIPTPPPFQCPDTGVESLGYNLADTRLCDLQPTDRELTDLALSPFDPAIAGYLPTGVAIDGGANAIDSEASGCGPVDQRGAPRPQTLSAGAAPRCDIGAIELGVNPYRGIWSPARSGHGLDLQTRGNVLMLAWYTYADDGQPTAYQAAAPLTGPRWDATLQWSRRDPATGGSTVVDVGRVSLDFASDTRATLGWRFDARGVEGTEQIEATLFDDGTPRFEVTGLWFPPAEPNYGATITRRGDTTALGLYYYDAAGTIRWALGTADDADASEFAMTSFTGFCPDCDAAQMPVAGSTAGTVVAHFQTPERARLDVRLEYPRGAGGTWRREAVRFVPLNDAVDNRAVVEADGD